MRRHNLLLTLHIVAFLQSDTMYDSTNSKKKKKLLEKRRTANIDKTHKG